MGRETHGWVDRFPAGVSVFPASGYGGGETERRVGKGDRTGGTRRRTRTVRVGSGIKKAPRFQGARFRKAGGDHSIFGGGDSWTSAIISNCSRVRGLPKAAYWMTGGLGSSTGTHPFSPKFW